MKQMRDNFTLKFPERGRFVAPETRAGNCEAVVLARNTLKAKRRLH